MIPSPVRHWKPVLIAAMSAIAVAALGALMTDLGPWYANLRKPAWQPPDWLFGPVWTLIFALCAISGYLAWREAPNRGGRDGVIGLFALNGFLNVLWSSDLLSRQAAGLGAGRGGTAVVLDRADDRRADALLEDREPSSPALSGMGDVRGRSQLVSRSA